MIIGREKEQNELRGGLGLAHPQRGLESQPEGRQASAPEGKAPEAGIQSATVEDLLDFLNSR